MYFPAREIPQQPTIHRPERQFALLRARPRAVYIIQYPRDLGRGKIRVQQQARFLADFRFVLFIRSAEIRCPPVLPDDSIINRLTGFAVPDDGCFALIGNADTENFQALLFRFLHNVAAGPQCIVPDIVRVLFYPAFMRIMKL